MEEGVCSNQPLRCSLAALQACFLTAFTRRGGGGVKKNTGARTKSRSKNMFFFLPPLPAPPWRNLTDYPFKRFAAARFQAELSAFQITGTSAGTAGGGGGGEGRIWLSEAEERQQI